eukprot:96934-Amphidinium_carterae.1
MQHLLDKVHAPCTRHLRPPCPSYTARNVLTPVRSKSQEHIPHMEAMQADYEAQSIDVPDGFLRSGLLFCLYTCQAT